MRHRKSGLKLNRNSSNRKALFRNLAIALIEHKVIKTTVPKAKELRRFVEPLITLSKEDSVANRRLAFSRLNNKKAVGELFTELAPKSKNRQGGYTRIIKAGYRAGDNAPMAYIELVDRHEDTIIIEAPVKLEQQKTEKAPTQPSVDAVEEVKVAEETASSEVVETESKAESAEAQPVTFAASVEALDTPVFNEEPSATDSKDVDTEEKKPN